MKVLIVRGAMLDPRSVPLVGLSDNEPREQFVGSLDIEVVQECIGSAVVGDMAMIEHEDAVVECEMPQAVRNRKDDAVVAPREVMHQLDNFVLGLRIESARHFVAK